MIFNNVMALILRYFTEFRSFRGALRKSVRAGGLGCHRKKFTFAISSSDEFLSVFTARRSCASAVLGVV